MAELRTLDRVRVILEADEFKLVHMALTDSLDKVKGPVEEVRAKARRLAHQLLQQHEKELAARLEAATGAAENIEATLADSRSRSTPTSRL